MSLHRSLLHNLRARGGNAKEFPLPRGWIGGLILSNGTDTDHDIDFSAGSCRDSGNLHNIESGSTIVKQLDQPWAADTAAGGLGTLQIDGSDTVTFGDGTGGSGRDQLTIDANTWTVNAEAGDTLIINGSSNGNDGTYQVLVAGTSTVVEISAGSWAAGESTSAATAHLIVDNDTYHCFAILSGRTVDFGFDTSLTAANLLSVSGYGYYRRIGSIMTDGSSNLIQFYQHGDMFALDLAADGYPEAATTNGTKTITLAGLPAGISVGADISAVLDDASTSFSVFRDGNISVVAAPDSSDYDILNKSGSTVNSWSGILWTNTSSQIKFHVSQDADTLHIQTRGWIDWRGKDD